MNYIQLKPSSTYEQLVAEKLLNSYVTCHRTILSQLLSQVSACEALTQTVVPIARCVARIRDKTQCTRKCKDDHSQLCGSHANSLPYGRVDDQQQKRKSKSKDCLNQDDIDLNKYIKTETFTIEDKEFLIDEHNIIFDMSDIKYTIVGQKLASDQYQWF